MRFPLVVTLLTSFLLFSLLPACSEDSPPGGGGPDAAADPPDAAPIDEPDASPPDAEFRRFRRSLGGGPCPDGEDCSGYVDVRRDRRLLVDKLGEVEPVIHEAEITQAELDEVIRVVTDPDLVAILDLGRPPCEPPTDVFESMMLVLDDGRHGNSVTFCDDAPLVAARAALDDLVDAYFP